MQLKYCCPSCEARSRFNVIEQVVTSIKIDNQTGDVHILETLDPFHQPYRGPEHRVQCANCGLVEDELRFVKMAEKLS
jgi:rubredoxin